MQKKLLFFLNVTLLGSTTSFVKAEGELVKLAVLGSLATIVTGGHFITQMNDDYSRMDKKPDLKLRLAKAVVAGGTFAAVDILMGDTRTTSESLAKILAGTATTIFTTAKPLTEVLRIIPVVGGILTDPIDKQGDERKDIGAFARFALVYFALRQGAISLFSQIMSRMHAY
jgi:hypothetical protein